MHVHSALGIHRNTFLGGMLTAALLLATAPLSAQTRDYNPIRRTSATEEPPAAARPKTSAPASTKTETWTPPGVQGPPGQWRSVRQPGPVQLPARHYMQPRASVQQ